MIKLGLKIIVIVMVLWILHFIQDQFVLLQLPWKYRFGVEGS